MDITEDNIKKAIHGANKDQRNMVRRVRRVALLIDGLVGDVTQGHPVLISEVKRRMYDIYNLGFADGRKHAKKSNLTLWITSKKR